ncbi:hypothetical protein Patl1_01485 [Pistacia atlantica]|uniref:Uncharacterized protein n=1 Tax=Pistacia atlantica TaxID=434234 RepID=A0ACC1CCR9_9ROSI|nr:hypothetical protein Patl1_01485 [Pistacia atlantica]
MAWIFHPRLVKLDFPRYNGEKDNWLDMSCRAVFLVPSNTKGGKGCVGIFPSGRRSSIMISLANWLSYNKRGHRCKKLFLIEGCDIKQEEKVMLDMVADIVEEIDGIAEISLHAICGAKALVAVTILVDSGSTHNFLSSKLTKKLGLNPTT